MTIFHCLINITFALAAAEYSKYLQIRVSYSNFISVFNHPHCFLRKQQKRKTDLDFGLHYGLTYTIVSKEGRLCKLPQNTNELV